MCFVWISEQTAIISLHSINWLVFITEAECVYCAVRTDSLKCNLEPLHNADVSFLTAVRMNTTVLGGERRVAGEACFRLCAASIFRVEINWADFTYRISSPNFHSVVKIEAAVSSETSVRVCMRACAHTHTHTTSH
jgi:hypothetical protein